MLPSTLELHDRYMPIIQVRPKVPGKPLSADDNRFIDNIASLLTPWGMPQAAACYQSVRGAIEGTVLKSVDLSGE